MNKNVAAYQGLLNDAVELIGAERAMIVLRSVLTNECAEFLVTCNVDVLPAPRLTSPNKGYTEAQYVWTMMNEIIGQTEPVLTTNANMDPYYVGQGATLVWTLRSVVALPLQKQGAVYGLLWCDVRLKYGMFTKDDLARLVTLVQRFHAII